MFQSLDVPLAELVESRFRAAEASQSLTFAPSSLAILHTDSGLPFQLRYCPSLAKKPLPSKDINTSKPKTKVNPFENPDPALFITDVPPGSTPPTHFLVLNKFPIIPSHFILATKVNKAQTAVLEKEDLAVAYECLRAWDDRPGYRLYGFFNSGENSGASQAHRHLQFVPVEGMKKDDKTGDWDVLIDKIVDSGAKMPFEVYWEQISSDTSSAQIHEKYDRLYESAFDAVKRFIALHPKELELHDMTDGSSPFSYNLGMTKTALMIIPRRREGSVLRNENGSDIGFAAFNGTVLAGTMMVKNEEEWDLLRGNDTALNQLLKGIGIPRFESTKM